MMDQVISLFIDNELGLNGKMEFVKKVHTDKAFMDQTVSLLEQETLLRSHVVERTPQVRMARKRSYHLPLWRPTAVLGSALAAALIIWLYFVPSKVTLETPYRFVIYQPHISRAEITGTFTHWRNLPMKRTGEKGYWEITLPVPKGEHRFIYILDGKQRFPDPTIASREQDDFGGENSILSI